ncbi:MAG: MFS transporter [Bdellovibrionales bacterium]|nr:MFS transporter [Bdellovibrionales bacterium]
MNQQLRQNVSSSYGDALFQNLMVGSGETYLAAFVLALGYSDLSAGWITSFPLLAGGLLQMVSPLMMRKMKSMKQWVVLTSFAQAVVLFMLSLQAYFELLSLNLIFLLASLYWATGMANGPAWNAWMGTIIPVKIRTPFFATRNVISQGAVLAGILLGGWWLGISKSQDVPVNSSFFFLFLVAGIFRIISAYHLSNQSAGGIPIEVSHSLQYRSIIQQIRGQVTGKLFLFMFILGIGVHVGAVFFNPLMLKGLGMSYGKYMSMLSTSIVARVLTLFFLRRYLRKWKSERVLLFAVLGVIPLPMLWNVSHNFGYLLCLQVLSGTAWGTYELVTFLLLFNGIRSQDKTPVLTLFNFMQTFSILIGSASGGWYLYQHGQSLSAYESLFNWSTSLRLCALFFFPGILLSQISVRQWLFTRPLAIRPSLGAMERPVVASIDSSDSDTDFNKIK